LSIEAAASDLRRESAAVGSCTETRTTPQPHTMNFTPADVEKLLLSVAGMVARDRLARGVRRNHPEAVALLSTRVIERAREGARVADLMESGRTVLTRDQVMPGVAELLHDVQVEATFPDGRKLVTIHSPII
jgi:urease subunit gamma